VLCCAVPCCALLQDVSLKLMLDAARGLAYMHEVDVVHGDVKSRNLLVFWEADEEDTSEESTPGQQNGDQDAAAADAEGGTTGGVQQQLARSSSARPPVWGLKWCDFGVSFRAAEAPGGILRTVSAGAAGSWV
jgi:serine/threonine protein kinase